MLNYFLQVREPTWGQQFKNAVMLGPSIDQDNLIVDHVTLSEGLFHFACIFWKLLFAIIPPTKKGGGWPAFMIALGLTALRLWHMSVHFALGWMRCWWCTDTSSARLLPQHNMAVHPTTL